MLLKGLCGLVCGCLMCLLAVYFYRKALDNNDLNQVCLTKGFVERRVYGGAGVGGRCSVSQAHKTWSRPFSFEDFHFQMAT